MSVVYATPEYVSTLATSTPISAHVPVDYELHGCPINKHQLLEVLSAYLNERRPAIPSYSVCVECKRRGNVCVMVAHGTPCLGPVTHAGCGAICPSYHRGCYGCFGPMESPNTPSLAGWLQRLGASDRDLLRSFRTYHATAEPFREQSDAHAEATAPDDQDRLPRPRRGRGRHARRDRNAPSRTSSCGSTSLRGSSRHSSAAARSWRLGHHRPHLRNLPGRLPDERVQRDGRRTGRHRERADPCASAASLLRRVDREPRSTSSCSTRPISSATRAHRRWRATILSSSPRASS